MNARFLYFTLALATFAAAATAEDMPEGTPLFSIISDSRNWDVNKNPGTPMISIDTPGGVPWTTMAFTYDGLQLGLWCGTKVPYVAYINNTQPLKDKIGIVSAYMYYEYDYAQYINSVKLLVSEDDSFSNCTEIECSVPEHNSTYWNFTVPEPAEDLYYRLCIDYQGVRDKWIRLDALYFFAPTETGEDPNGEEEGNAGTFAVNCIDTDHDRTGTQWYDVHGRRVDNPTRGLYIVREGQTVRKVMR